MVSRRSSNGSDGEPRQARIFRASGTARPVITRGRAEEGSVPVSSFVDVDAAGASDEGIRQAYRELRSRIRSDGPGRRRFRRCRRRFRSAIRSDHARTRSYPFRKAKWVSVLAFAYGTLLGWRRGLLSFPVPDAPAHLLECIREWTVGNLGSFVDGLQEAPLIISAVLLSAAVYAGAVLWCRPSDRRILRRLMVHAMSEGMTDSDVDLFRAGFAKNRKWRLLYGRTSIFDIREAAGTKVLNDFLRGMGARIGGRRSQPFM